VYINSDEEYEFIKKYFGKKSSETGDEEGALWIGAQRDPGACPRQNKDCAKPSWKWVKMTGVNN